MIFGFRNLQLYTRVLRLFTLQAVQKLGTVWMPVNEYLIYSIKVYLNSLAIRVE